MTELNIRLLLVGDTNVGKTSIILQFTENYIPQDHGATVGIECKVKTFKYKDYQIKLQIWDTAGQERFHSITNNFFRNADGIIFVYDITKHETFEGAKSWIKEADDIGDYFQKIIIGNKCDLEDKRKVSLEELSEFASEENINFFEVSARNNINITEMFYKATELILEDKNEEDIIKEFSTKKSSLSVYSKRTNVKKKNDSKKCC